MRTVAEVLEVLKKGGLVSRYPGQPPTLFDSERKSLGEIDAKVLDSLRRKKLLDVKRSSADDVG